MNLKSALEDILFSNQDFSLISRGINYLYERFSETTNIYAGNLTNEHMKETANGKVVTPIHAAHCLKELARTTHFLRAIHLAIEHHLKYKKSIRILYAGCGPYGTLLTPFSSIYSADQIQFTFLEIEEESVNSVKSLYTELSISEYLESTHLCDATDPELSLAGSFDIIISETMQMALNNECQVPITRNMVRFLTKEGTFIPERIALDVYLVGRKKDPLVPDSDEKEFVGTAFDFDINNLPAKDSETILTIPKSALEYLKLYTNIHLFGEECLKAYQCSLTMPLILDRPLKKAGRSIRFWYEENERPKLKFEYLPENS
ncbi:SAM-dependent methyltransferase [Marinoscillum furvescens]|uniref:Methyltransferase family protein n=1 Tax=Marinoscillum furvescens DSM 4134 TaxID=1122208 RepID=A0A3D9L7T4_MARFU|nr:hypothetical protein [Marinoscillum furvescens]REE01719.1 hypothetical protein C7460_103236 [Marinoscillum furvescens DSM 4134]